MVKFYKDLLQILYNNFLGFKLNLKRYKLWFNKKIEHL